ncbi:MAG TPA: periplasmic heavy metal sensor [Methylomirabilota bacterium]|nr:periplasmic heavy metal sensor [Methylomirabilota bacterium]
MNRPLVILLSALTLCAGIFIGSYLAARHMGAMCAATSTDDLAWLREEFHLSDAEMARVRQLHEGYMPKCMDMCSKIAAKKQEVADALNGGTNITAEAQKKLTELGELRAKCQAQMLEHFIAVSRAMPPEQGKRYLAEMQRVTLDLHENMEQSMSQAAGKTHGHE